jgi:hypothetical protein
LEKTEAYIDWLIQLEDRPFTLNNHYLSDYKDKFFSYYKGSREKDNHGSLMQTIKNYKTPVPNPYNPSPPTPTGVSKVLAGLVEIGMVGVNPGDLPKLLPPDGMESALTIMADVRSYFQGMLLYLHPS